MNKSLIRNLIFVAVMSVFLPCAAYADDLWMHETGSSSQGCNRCHQVHKALGVAGYNNICLNCHRLGRIEQRLGSQIAPFSQGDMATSQGPSQGILDPKRTQSSHRWDGDAVVPRAGADEPINQPAGMEGPRNAYVGKLYCARCHGIHVASSPAPFLRAANDQDQLCLNCHRSRNQTSHLTGTHPVNVNYATIATQAPAEYNNPPKNSNPANYTSDLNKNLPAGKVLCSTCHSVHYGDSNSRTFDNASSAKFSGLSSSKGYLLRTDLTGRNSADINICTNCHRTTDENGVANSNPNAKVKNHDGAKKQNIQCADCHGGHVDEADGTTPNAFLIKRYMNVSSLAGRTPKVMFQYTSATGMNYAKDAYGVCVACHTVLPAIIPQHTDRTNTPNCKSCHTHKAGFSASCTDCHGMPPVANVAGGAGKGYANQPFNYTSTGANFKNESLTPHFSHATNDANAYSYSCSQCHNGYQATHANGTFQDVFNANSDKAGIIASTKGATPTYVGGVAGTCSAMYCHSNGAGGGYKTVTWAGTKGSIIGQTGECAACHDAKPATSSHSKHISGGITGKSYACSTCHAATVNSAAVVTNKAKHVNGIADVSFSGTIGSIVVSACTSCHNNAAQIGFKNTTSVKWGVASTGACGTCHANPMTNNGHTAHLTALYGPLFGTADVSGKTNCSKCHTTFTGEFGATHVDGTKDTSLTSCLPCHPGTAGQYTWTAGRVTCDSCHSTATLSSFNNISAPSTRLAATFGHGKPSGANQSCTFCHDNTSAHLNSNPTVHVKRLNSILTTPATLNIECNYCHTDLVRVNNKPKFLNMSTHFTAPGGPQAMECAKCHDLHGTNNSSMIREKIAYINTTSWRVPFTNRDTDCVNTVTNRGLCQVCHTRTKYYRAGVVETGHPADGCLNCHPHNAKGGAFAPAGSCNACHGYPPVPKSAVRGNVGPYKGTFGTYNNYTNAKYEDYSGGGGAHLNHVPTYAKATEGWKNCGICHNNGNTETSTNHVTKMPLKNNISNVTIKIAQYVNFNNTLQVSYTGARLVNPPLVNSTGSCINVGCHFQPTPRWSKDR